MIHAGRLRRYPAPFCAALAVACALGAGSAMAMPGSPHDAPLSPRLAELAEPPTRSAPPAEQAEALSLAPDGPGSLLRKGNRVLVDVRFDRGAAAALDELRAAGAQIVHTARRYQTVTAAARPAELPALAEVPGVTGVTEVLSPVVSAVSCAGLVTSEGDGQLGAATARPDFGVDGSGVTVGILSDSFDTAVGPVPTRAADDVASGDLPGPGNPCGRTTPTNRLSDYTPGKAGDPSPSDEGRAMAQIVHDLAPGASLAFATAFQGEFSFANNIRALAKAGAKVIVDDVLYLKEPFFQDGPVAVAVNEVTATGVAYFSSAGNNNLIDKDGNDIASWEAHEFRDTSCPPELTTQAEAEACMDFDPGPGADPTFEVTVSPGVTLTVDLQWAEPRFGARSDLDVFLLNDEDEPIAGNCHPQMPAVVPIVGSCDNNIEKTPGSTEAPVEIFAWKNDGKAPRKVRLAVNRCAGTCNPGADPAAKPRLKLMLLQNGGGVTATEYPQSAGGDVVGPTIFGHNGAASAISVGAIRYNTTTEPERFSSRGPLTHYFGPVSGTSAAPALGSPMAISKPDLVATDGGANTFFGQLSAGVWRFLGTSAAAPHGAAVAALMRQANPSLSLAQIRTVLAATARPVGAFGPGAVGAGLIDAYAAVGSVALPPVVRVTGAPPALSRNRSPSIGFAANRPATFSCSLDAGPLLPCSSPYAPPAPLADGRHGFAVRGVDLAGRVGTSETVHFTIDTKAPRTSLRRKPRKRVRTRKARVRVVFQFRSNEEGSTFVCRIDRGLFRFCPARFVRRVRPGRHVVRVKAVDPAGNADPTPVVYRFHVKRVGRRAP